MKSIYEYLLSKENKSKINKACLDPKKKQVTLSSLENGDILIRYNNDMAIYIDENYIRKHLKEIDRVFVDVNPDGGYILSIYNNPRMGSLWDHSSYVKDLIADRRMNNDLTDNWNENNSIRLVIREYKEKKDFDRIPFSDLPDIIEAESIKYIPY